MKIAQPQLPDRSVWSLDALARADLLALLDTAERLKRVDRAGKRSAPLRGRNVAVVGDTSDSAVRAFSEAARDLGAKVAVLSANGHGAPLGSARLLGQLYDAVDCPALAPGQLGLLARDAGVPVFDGIGADDHPTACLADLLSMLEHGGRALDTLSLGVVGEPRAPCTKALVYAARLAGMGTRIAESRTQAAAGADFVLDDDGRLPIADAERADNRRFTLQALLVYTIA